MVGGREEEAAPGSLLAAPTEAAARAALGALPEAERHAALVAAARGAGAGAGAGPGGGGASASATGPLPITDEAALAASHRFIRTPADDTALRHPRPRGRRVGGAAGC